jgi:UDP-sulfoquinovose synthase
MEQADKLELLYILRTQLRCIELAIKDRPLKNDRVKIFNQMTETHNIKDLAETVSSLTGAKIEYLINPRNEDSQNDLFVENDCFLQLGLKPTTLKEGLLIEIKDIAKKYSNRCDKTKIVSKSFWNKEDSKKYKY